MKAEGFLIRKFMVIGMIVLFLLSLGVPSYGEEMWSNILYNIDEANSVRQTNDGGFIIVGIKFLVPGRDEVCLLKTDAKGNEIWYKTFGGKDYDYGYSVEQTTDGGYIIAGDYNYNDIYLIKTDANGNEMWSKTFGPGKGRSVKQTTDGGYIITGQRGIVYLLKTDASGNKMWGKYFGEGVGFGYSVEQTIDGGYIIAGELDKQEGIGGSGINVYLLKTDANGNEMWSKTFGGANSDYGRSVKQTTDGGYIITGYTYSFGAGYEDVYLIKTDGNGNEMWSKTFGGISYEGGYSVVQTTDGGYAIAGYTHSFGVYTRSDFYLIKTDGNGNEMWYKTFGDANGNVFEYGRSLQQTTDGGYIIAGPKGSPSPSNPSHILFGDAYLVYYKRSVTTNQSSKAMPWIPLLLLDD
jgi:hypothetical protein